MNPTDSNDGASLQQPGSVLRGRSWKSIINGRRALNGSRHSITLTGTIEHAEEWSTIIDVMHDLAEHIEEHTREMEIKDSFQVTLYPPNDPSSPTAAGAEGGAEMKP